MRQSCVHLSSARFNLVVQQADHQEKPRQPVVHSNGHSEGNASLQLSPPNERQEAVRGAFKHAWAGYKKFAWGEWPTTTKIV